MKETKKIAGGKVITLNILKEEKRMAEYGKCLSCGMWLLVNDCSLCSICDGKAQRDLIRLREWDYVVVAFGLPKNKREELRQNVIEEYGEKLELFIEE